MFVSHTHLLRKYFTLCSWKWAPCTLRWHLQSFTQTYPNHGFPFNMTHHNISHTSNSAQLWQVAKENVKSGRFFTRKKHWRSASPRPWTADISIWALASHRVCLFVAQIMLYNIVNMVKSVFHKLWKCNKVGTMKDIGAGLTSHTQVTDLSLGSFEILWMQGIISHVERPAVAALGMNP